MARLALQGLALCLAIGALARATYVTPEEERLMQWIIEEGGILKATVGRTAQGVRGVFTTEDIPKGETVIMIPPHLVLSVRSVAAADDATFLLREMHTPCSRLKPYMDVLPKEGQVLTGYNFPEEYVQYLADDHLVMTIPEAIGRTNMSLPYWEYVVSLLSSRTFSMRKNTLSMVPFLDLMNHDPRNINQLSDSATDIRLIAGRDLVKGEEITITYGNMRSDELLLYYGFIDTVTQPPRLLAVDHRNYKPYGSEELSDEPITGPPELVAQELLRLTAILARFESRLEQLGPIPDTIPEVADVLRGLHAQRRETLNAEIRRLEGLARSEL
ncbi:hypothetical protein GPECTOR_82g240 [Gonium pectorale]|uniref:SET domain-containing protein n=1 Tax=Gonium pectorale TaxID=33097 RepID=A0A150G1F8_GONPE|nr:hypothetical protein GPECTOR_82g240 [Gonium pectorale]|eukprot:KXZ43706.1 hypothetical protein GPECTOR_82g240 [Gonium pectorale]